MLSPIVRFKKVADAYRMIDEKQKETIKLDIIYD